MTSLTKIAIVLMTIIALLGVMIFSQDLIRAAEKRALLEQLYALQRGVHEFESRFHALPGDFAKASQFITNAQNGNGNRLIDNQHSTEKLLTLIAGGGEYLQFFFQLSTLGMIDGNYYPISNNSYQVGTNLPAAKNGLGGIIAYSLDAVNYYHIGVISNPKSLDIITANTLPPHSAYELDNKIDDGLANSGALQARGGTSIEMPASTGYPGSLNCTIKDGIIYNIWAPTGNFCQMRVRFQ